MIKTILDVNTNKLHDELIAKGITPLLVENKDNKTYITFQENTDMEMVQQIIDTHDPTPLSPQPSKEEILEQRINDLEIYILMQEGLV